MGDQALLTLQGLLMGLGLCWGGKVWVGFCGKWGFRFWLRFEVGSAASELVPPSEIHRLGVKMGCQQALVVLKCYYLALFVVFKLSQGKQVCL